MGVSIDLYDSCVISRFTGNVDDYGDEVRDIVYSGECIVQISRAESSRFDRFEFEHQPMLFIPVNDVILKVNDFVEVTTFNGRKINYTILNYESITDKDFEELNDTCIWLKDGKDSV